MILPSASVSVNCGDGRIRISVHGSAAAIDERGGDDNCSPKSRLAYRMAFGTVAEPLSAVDFRFGSRLDAVRDFASFFELLDFDVSTLALRWWPGTESNRRRQPFQGCALP